MSSCPAGRGPLAQKERREEFIRRLSPSTTPDLLPSARGAA
ncbi:hypothetical protein [Nannocystis punicea]|uniref:Uncharacterized protein n=1 Tax=Nannocystis punicea TaxID=2995304 RepID=A0ABY7HJG6_9BACT|nr:hypothetical protein [Nannocystis poenicansa]WAS99200.1 hypothetical protein O0S08_23985 [Nannocystis poenicansa]